MTVTIDKEKFTQDLFQELLPLAQKCWEESTLAKAEKCAFYGERDFQIEPDIEQYQRLNDMGSLVIVTLRNGALKGYVSGFTYKALHHKGIVGAIGDTLYVEPEYRSYAGIVIDKFMDEMRERKVQIVGWPVTPEGYIHQLLKARGFVGDDVVMEKRLCVSQLQS